MAVWRVLLRVAGWESMDDGPVAELGRPAVALGPRAARDGLRLLVGVRRQPASEHPRGGVEQARLAAAVGAVDQQRDAIVVKLERCASGCESADRLTPELMQPPAVLRDGSTAAGGGFFRSGRGIRAGGILAIRLAECADLI